VDQPLTGTYVLLLHLAENQTIAVGRLGEFDFPAGWYTYIGSAFGAGGLLGRIKHHLRPVQSPHWHIDYLRRYAPVQEIWLSPDTERREEAWVDMMIDIPGAVALIEGFGASDTHKETHLFYFDVRPSLEDFAVGVHTRFPGTQVLRAYATAEE
jgi:Uri superfamily endonuclease